jgi:predicted ATP-dependent serine protease
MTVLHGYNHQTKMTLPAEPLLASTLYAILDEARTSNKRKRVGTACSPIDDALRGGIDNGRVTCISGEKGSGKTTVGEICIL